MRIKYLLILIVGFALLQSPAHLLAQAQADSLYEAGRKTAFEFKDNVQATKLIRAAVAMDSTQLHYQVFLARLLSWQSQYDEALGLLEQVLNQNGSDQDAHLARVDALLWSNQPERLLKAATLALEQWPEQEQLLLRLVQAQITLGQAGQARETLERLLALHPGHDAGQKLLESLQSSPVPRKIKIGLSYDRLADTRTAWQFLVTEANLDPWSLLSLEYEHPFGFGPLMIRMSHASRFSQEGIMLELESYPKLGTGRYAYLGMGLSPSDIFPEWRAGAEIFQGLKGGIEVSGGVRILKVPTETLSVITLSAGKYLGNLWLNARLFLTPQSEALSRSVNLLVRRYYGDHGNFFEISGGSGQVPDGNLGNEEINYLSARRVSAGWQTALLSDLGLMLKMDFQNQEVRPDAFRGISGISCSIEKAF